MLKLYHSNDLEVLKGILLHLMEQEPPPPFQPEVVMVQSQGMAHWLKLQVADGLGVAAQLDFPLPSSFVWQVYNALFPELPERSHFDKQLMIWKLIRLLPDLATQEGCEAIAAYLQADASGVRRYQLAQTIADVFDQYLVYRPDWLLAWESGEDKIQDAEVELQPWQPIVWRALVSASDELGHSLQHRARIQDMLAEQVARFPERLKQLPKRVFVFGIAALPGSYWDALEAISEHLDIHYLLLNPCRNFWGDLPDARRRARILQHSPESAAYLERGNPLLGSWGRLGRDFLTRVHDSEKVQDMEAWVEPHRQTLLGSLQSDILEMEDPQQAVYSTAALTTSDFKPRVRREDESVRIVSAHSPLREVQRLHDQLLHWFQLDSDLRPRDIVVMVPDIDQYAPYIEAVFSSAGLSEQDRTRRIPWAIADQSMSRENPLLDSYLGLLGLSTSRLLVTDVEDWLEVPAIRARFAIAESDLPLLQEWLAQANVRWGLDGEHRRELGMSGFEQNSWRKGLRQLLLGMMTPDNAPGWCGDWPVSAVEGSQSELLGNLMAFVDQLEIWQRLLKKEHSPEQWLTVLGQLIEAFFEPAALVDSEELNQAALSVQLIRDSIAAWGEDLELSGLLGAESDTAPAILLPVRVVQQQMNERLNQQGGWQRFLAGPVNVCTLMPMRSIPFRAVCMLGMNDADYPRPVTPVGFDLMQSGKTRAGDRSRRDDDRFLFMEAVCSARDYFYVSYRGRSQQDNSEQQPSVLVSELLDYLGDSYCLEADCDEPHEISRRHMRDWLVEHLPLQPFNPAGFTQESDSGRPVGSFQPLWANVADPVSRRQSADELANSRQQTLGSDLFIDKMLSLPEELAACLQQKDGMSESLPEVRWSDIKQACRDCCGFFFKRRLKAMLDPREEQRETEEPFQADGLTGYEIKQSLIERLVKNRQSELGDLPEQLQSLGQLPVGGTGVSQAEALFDAVQPLSEALLKLPLDEAEVMTVQKKLDFQSDRFGPVSLILTGDIQRKIGDQLIRYRVGQIRGQDWLDYWMDLVLAAADGQSGVHALYAINGDGEGQYLQAPDQQQAILWLEQWVEFYLLNWQQPQTLMPAVLWAGVAAKAAKGKADVEMEDRLTTMMKASASDQFGPMASSIWHRCHPQLSEKVSDQAWMINWYESWSWMLEPCFAAMSDDESEAGEASNGK